MTYHTSHSPLVLTVLQHVTVDRLQKAVTALAEGSLTMKLTRQTEAEIRALVKEEVRLSSQASSSQKRSTI